MTPNEIPSLARYKLKALCPATYNEDRLFKVELHRFDDDLHWSFFPHRLILFFLNLSILVLFHSKSASHPTSPLSFNCISCPTNVFVPSIDQFDLNRF